MSTAMLWEESLLAEVDECYDDILALRQHLHQFPELSGEEQETSLLLYQRLGDMGAHVRMGLEGRGVLADLSCGRDTRICLRGDIDALRIPDEKTVSYCSQRPGIMHACGHDAHTAMVFGATTAIHRILEKHQLRPTHGLRAIFQPAEEICQGANEMIQVGALDHAVKIYSVHVDPTRPVGTVGVRNGVLTAACDEVLFELHGAGGHAARPHQAVDPITAAAHLIQVLYKFIPRVTDSQDAVVLTVGRIQGGHNSNVIPEKVELGGTLRTLSVDVRENTLAHIQRLAEGVSHISGARIEYRAGMSVPSVVNELHAERQIESSATEVLGGANVSRIDRPSMGSEDFAYYLEKVSGAMFRLGCASETVGCSGLHTSLFDVDREALRHGAKILAHAAMASMME